MNVILRAVGPVLAGSLFGFRVAMPWFAPIAALIGVLGTRTGFRQQHVAGKARRDKSWWLILVVAWLPAICWALAQFVRQY